MSTAATASRAINTWIGPVVLGATIAGLLLRVGAGLTMTPHIDEAESVIAARIVASTGLPLLPSGVLFLQGLTLSYILPLFDRSSDPFDLGWLRGLSALAGAASIPAVFRLSLAFGASRSVAALAAVALAFDGASIEWSAHVRPYALLQLITILLLTLWLGAVDKPSTRQNVWMSVLFFLGVFTHVGIVLVLPAMGLLSVLRHGRALYGLRRDLLLTYASFALPLLLFVGINTAFGVTTSGSNTARPSFIGDHLVALSSLIHPELDPWRALFQASATRDFVPYMLVFSAAMLLLRRAEEVGMFRLLVSYALPITLVAVATTEAQARYLLHIHPLSWIIIGGGLEEAWRMAGPHQRAWRALAMLGGLLSLSHFTDGAYARLLRTYIDPDYPKALKWLEGQHTAGEPVITSMTSVTWFSSIPQSDFRFLAGPQGADRTVRYSRMLPDGRVTDYWTGVPAITSTLDLCNFIRANPNSWLVIDEERLHSSWAYAGPMEKVIVGTSAVMFEEDEVPAVYRALVEARWTPGALAACAEAARPPVEPLPPNE